MIDLYTWSTPNGRKANIMVAECGLELTLHRVDIGAGQQHDPEFLKISPNNKIPAIVDHDGPGGQPLALFESGAILLYLAEKTGRFLPEQPARRYQAIQWLMFQMAGVGPMLGQLFHFKLAAQDEIPYAVDRYTTEVQRLLGVMERQLDGRDALAGEYSIADIATYPWIMTHERLGLEPGPNVCRWLETVGARPAVQHGMELLDS